MAHTPLTWGLTEDWDLAINVNGSPELLRDAEAVAQDVANEARLFLHDAYFRYEDGIRWFTDQLGKPVQTAVITDRLRQAALRVPGVVRVITVQIDELDLETRTLHGRIGIASEAGHGASVF